MTRVTETELVVPRPGAGGDLLAFLAEEVAQRCGQGAEPVRFVINRSDEAGYRCEVGVIEGGPPRAPASIFEHRVRRFADQEAFNVVFLVPTGVGCEIGGHAGDANAAARLVAGACDTVITHPNVVNASDINELPANGLYVEGSIISRLMMGTVGLRRVRANRVLSVIEAHEDVVFEEVAINTVNAARATFGLRSAGVVRLEEALVMSAEYAASGRAVGRVDGLEHLFSVLDERRGDFDAVALSSRVRVPGDSHREYFRAGGEMINPWGGVEAMLTHAVSHVYNVPTAHAPMEINRRLANLEFGVVDARMAAEVISRGYFMCVLKGLHRSPQIVERPDRFDDRGVLCARDVSCLVIPDKCVGLPTLSALIQGIPVIAVRENDNIMENDLAELPWAPGQLHYAKNYWEAVGIMQALRVGMDPRAVRRPLATSAP